MDDELSQIRRLAGISEFKGYKPYDVGQLQGSNISLTGMEKADLMRQHDIRPGTPEWFRLWFTRPYLTNTDPLDPKFR
jgi:hypothetical protein